MKKIEEHWFDGRMYKALTSSLSLQRYAYPTCVPRFEPSSNRPQRSVL